MASSWWLTLVWYCNNEISFLYSLKCLYILAKREVMHRKIRQPFKKHFTSKIFTIISPEKGILYFCNEISYHELSEFIIIKAVGTAGYLEKGYEKTCIPFLFLAQGIHLSPYITHTHILRYFIENQVWQIQGGVQRAISVCIKFYLSFLGIWMKQTLSSYSAKWKRVAGCSANWYG